MKYKNKSISLSTLVLSKNGPQQPLCNNCSTKDCGHLIEKTQVSILGVNKQWKLLSKGDNLSCVVECEGYSH